jgi:asparagine synthase (glutamine-hydrolysing)
MCGIAGIVKLRPHDLHLPAAAKAMTDSIRHRGPDGEGFLFSSAQSDICAGDNDTPADIFNSRYPWSPTTHTGNVSNEPYIALGHRRLSIIDLSPAGHQPMCDASKKLWIVFNGEIYNYIEVREELKLLGHQFITGTDTEVIITAYRQWGTECVLRFNGMWAFVLYDKEKNILFGSRDRFGVKPFYYYKDKNIFAFASEQKALVKQSFVSTSINDKAVVDFFVKSEIEYEEEGMFTNVIELFPSYSFTLDLSSGALKKWKYYTLSYNDKFEAYDERRTQQAAEQVKELLENAIALRLRSDVTVGSCLSGGIDSSAIVGIVNHLLTKNSNINIGERLKVFTASFSDKLIDESKWAAQVAEATGADWKRTFPDSKELLEDIGQLIYSQDVPIWSTSTYAQHRVMKLAKQSGVTVVLDGQGGDELFAGYPPYYLSYWKELAAHQGNRSLLKELRMYAPLSSSVPFYLKASLKYNLLPRLSRGMQNRLQKLWFAELGYLDNDLLSRNSESVTFAPQPTAGSLNGILYNEFYNTRLKGYLKCEDRCSMWHSVESRTPFADDHPLIEYAFTLPGVMKIHNGTNKYVLREAVRPFVPGNILARKDKMGYVTPTRKWISETRNELRPLFDESLKGYIDTKKLLRDFDKLFDRPHLPDNGRIFKFISFALWKKAFFS